MVATILSDRYTKTVHVFTCYLQSLSLIQESALTRILELFFYKKWEKFNLGSIQLDSPTKLGIELDADRCEN